MTWYQMPEQIYTDIYWILLPCLGATFEDVKLMHEHVWKWSEIKAQVESTSFEDAEKFISILEQDRLGTSRLEKIKKGMPTVQGY